jgi:hypothetical protein
MIKFVNEEVHDNGRRVSRIYEHHELGMLPIITTFGDPGNADLIDIAHVAFFNYERNARREGRDPYDYPQEWAQPPQPPKRRSSSRSKPPAQAQAPTCAAAPRRRRSTGDHGDDLPPAA